MPRNKTSKLSTNSLQALVGRNVRAHRKRLGLSQEQLAEQAGVHRTYVGGIERGERNVTLAAVAAIADALDIEPHVLLDPEGAAGEESDFGED